jgi:hypothetical protein
VKVGETSTGEKYFTYGALVYAKPIEANEIIGKTYENGFQDLSYEPKATTKYSFLEKEKATYANGKITTKLINQKTNEKEITTLIPIGKTILRQTTFN